MENFAPGLKDSVVALADALRFVVFFIAVAGFMLTVARSRGSSEEIAGSLVRSAIVIGLVATLPHWFGFTERIFLSLADVVHEDYTQHPMRAAAKLRATVTEGAGGFSLRRVEESLYKAFLWGAAKLLVLIASVLQLPFLILQYVLKLLCYLFLPVALALMLVPSLSSLGSRYVQQTIAILSWPVGFAVTELVAYHLLVSYGENLSAAYDLTPAREIDGASFGSLLGGLFAGVWLIVGTIGTPFLMQSLICSGSPLSAGGGAALQQIYSIQQLAWMIKALKTGGAAAPALAAQSAGKSGGGSPPPPPAPAPTPAAPPPGPSAGDPAGDQRAALALGSNHLPAPQTTI
ncbi:MAG: hypothetical protein KF715_19720 [Candidatus Didemnitutus sp.]|nr:hypothetical protein [Candidatus Didemnitutus sp.]